MLPANCINVALSWPHFSWPTMYVRYTYATRTYVIPEQSVRSHLDFDTGQTRVSLTDGQTDVIVISISSVAYPG